MDPQLFIALRRKDLSNDQNQVAASPLRRYGITWPNSVYKVGPRSAKSPIVVSQSASVSPFPSQVGTISGLSFLSIYGAFNSTLRIRM